MKFHLTAIVMVFFGGSLAAQGEYRFIKQADKALPLTSFNVTFRAGSADDPKEAEGLAYLTGELLREGGVQAWKGLPARSRAEVEEFLYPFAADIDVSVGREQTAFQVTVPSADAESVFQLLAQMILSPAFDAAEFGRLKSQMLDALKKQLPREDEEELGKAALERVVYGASHPYSHVPQGTVTAVSSLSLDRINEFFKKYFTQSRLSVGVAGVVSPKLEALCRSAFRSLPQGSVAQTQIPAAFGNAGDLKLLLVKGPFDAVGIHLGEALPINRRDADFSRLYLAAMAFGKHRSFVGRLMNVVREIRGLNYGTYAYIEEFPHGGHSLIEPTQAARSRQSFAIWARPTTPDNACFLLRQLHRETRKLAQTGLSPKEFESAKQHLIGGAPLLATGVERRLGYAVDSVFYGLKRDYLEGLQADARQAKQAEVNALLRKYIHPDEMKLVVVTSDPIAFESQILGPRCDIHYAAGVEKASAVLAEDKEIATYDIGLKKENIQTIDAEALFLK